VLLALLEADGTWIHGYDIVKRLGIASGSLYPILMRLHDRGIVETRWEDSPLEGRPRRHMYRLTEDGAKWARSMSAVEGPTPKPRPEMGTA
jgi:DNA-binding PadR family transcriptional regulator